MKLTHICFLIMVIVYVLIFIYERVTGNSIFGKVKQNMPILESLKLLTKAVSGVYPSEYFENAYLVIEAAIHATTKAEELWKMGSISKDMRPKYCADLIADTLREVDIEVTDQIKQIIDGVVALTCMLMPHEEHKEETETEPVD